MGQMQLTDTFTGTLAGQPAFGNRGQLDIFQRIGQLLRQSRGIAPNQIVVTGGKISVLEGKLFVDQMVVVNLAFVPGMAAGLVKDITERCCNTLGNHIGIGADQHTAEKLLAGIDIVVQLAHSAFEKNVMS